jgi:hypothetical protein
VGNNSFSNQNIIYSNVAALISSTCLISADLGTFDQLNSEALFISDNVVKLVACSPYLAMV